jgi:hypothetical protein
MHVLRHCVYAQMRRASSVYAFSGEMIRTHSQLHPILCAPLGFANPTLTARADTIPARQSGRIQEDAGIQS